VRNGNLTHTIRRTDKLTLVLDALQYFDAVRVNRRIGYRRCNRRSGLAIGHCKVVAAGRSAFGNPDLPS
jgi:hypothetical protein